MPASAGFALSGLLLFGAVFLPAAQLPSFEVASVKPFTPAPAGTPTPRVKVAPSGAPAAIDQRVHFIGQIELLIEAAYGLPFSSDNRIVGGPEWIRRESERYDVTAKIGDAHYEAMRQMSPAQQKEQVSLMERSLLAERFQFRAHLETREMPGYALAIAKGGSKLERASADDKSQLSFVRNGQEFELRGTAVSLEELAQSPFLRIDKRLIVDKTGIQGRFNFTLKWNAGGDESNAPELPAALQAQLGLRLVPENRPVEVVVIDRIERPTEN